jgi:hypothetical protein
MQNKQIITYIEYHSRREYISIENKSSSGTPKPRRGFTLFDRESPPGNGTVGDRVFYGYGSPDGVSPKLNV